jgi:hypothetical protein
MVMVYKSWSSTITFIQTLTGFMIGNATQFFLLFKYKTYFNNLMTFKNMHVNISYVQWKVNVKQVKYYK